MIWQCCFNSSNVVIIAVKGLGYCCIIDETKSGAIHLFWNSVLNDHGYIQNTCQILK